MAVLSNKGKRIDELVSLDANQIANNDLLVIQDVQPTSTTKNITYQNVKDKISTDIQSSALTLFPSTGTNQISASKIHVTNRGTFQNLRVLNDIKLPDTTSFNNTVTNFNNVNITGSATVFNQTVTNRLTAANITGSLKGTGSWSRRSVTASHALIANTTLFCQTNATNADTASFLVYSGTPNGTSSFAIKSITSSYSLRAVSSSYAGYALNANSAQTSNTSISSNQATSAYTASYILFDAIVKQGGFNGTASYATNAKTASYVTNAKTASYARNANTASYVSSQYNPGIAKAWVNFSTAGEISSSYNVSSVSKTGTGRYTINFASPSPFTNNQYVMVGTATIQIAGTPAGVLCYNVGGTKSTSQVQVKTLDNSTDALFDANVNAIFFGF